MNRLFFKTDLGQTSPEISSFLNWSAILLASVLLSACGGGGSKSSVSDNGAAPSSAARSTPLPVGDTVCSNGGILVETGIDDNKNGQLDDAEVDSSEKVCNGLDGTDGQNGADGQDGTNGQNGSDGQDGTNGLNALVKMTLEPAGANCPYKGIRIDSGQDANSNGQLDAGEISDTQYVCNLIDGQIGWQEPTRIEYSNAGDAVYPQVAIDDNGNAIAVWYQSDGTRDNIWANRYVPGTGWGATELIETDNTGNAQRPQIAMDSNGNAIAVWYQYDGTRTNIWANSYTIGSGWDNAEVIETDNAGSAYNPEIAIDANGNAIAVWQQHDGTRYNIWANRYLPNNGWGTAKLIETDNTGHAQYPQIAIDSSGNAIAIWRQWDGARDNIWSNRYTSGSDWGTPELVETDNAGSASSPQIAFDSNGNALAVWQQSDGTRDNIWSNRYTTSNGWGTSALIETDNAGNAQDPQIAVDVNGNAIAVWKQYSTVGYNILANRYTAGSGWGTAQLIETDNAGYAAQSPQVAIDGNGNAIAVWDQSDGTRENIRANRYIAGSGWGSAELIESDNTSSAYSPQVAIDANGNAIAVWFQSDGMRHNIMANRWLAP